MPRLLVRPGRPAAALLGVVLAVAGCTGQAATPPPTSAPTAAVKAAAPTAAAAAPTAAPKAVAPTTAPTAAPKAVAPTTAPTAAPKAVAPTTAPTAAPKTTGPLMPTNLAAMPKVEVLVSGLDTPWAIDFAPDGRIFVTERGGRIRTITDGKLDPEPWLTLDVAEVGESGLMGLTLDPNFAQNRYLYATYTYRQGNQLFNRLVRLRDDPATGKGIEDKTLVDAVPTNVNHSGGRVRFGPDGKLYWTMGDAQQTQLAQNPSSLLGKVMRLNPDGSA
ncbi:MAG: PQQ-dependent sugar dehydrogenase, partial [Anaerolineae bacterium]|nr:PQQ-dependent sugar dehydrogenase [Anaerolineae bacterium]